MIVDVHCHLALPARRVRPEVERFSFEPTGAIGLPGYDAYLPPALRRSLSWRFVGKKLGLDLTSADEEQLDLSAEQAFAQHLLNCPSVDRIVLLAFDEYYTDAGMAAEPLDRRRPSAPEPRVSARAVSLGAVSAPARPCTEGTDEGAGEHPQQGTRGAHGSSMYTSNSLVRHFCRQAPEKLLFGASIHPYRPGAIEALDEARQAGAVLIKWLPLTQNIDPRDERTQTFVRRAGELGIALLIHYGGEVTLPTPHPRLTDPEPMLDLLTRLHREGVMPPTIIAHAATPSFPWQPGPYFHRLIAAMRGDLRDAPLYADVSALYYRPWWLRKLVHGCRYADVRKKLVFGSDFPVIPSGVFFPITLARRWKYIHEHSSWIERSCRLLRSIGVPDGVFARAAEVLGLDA